MEFFYNIFKFLNTPNELLLNIINIPLAFIENFLIFILFISILNIKTSKNQKLIYCILIPSIGLLSMLIFPPPFYIFFNCLMIVILTYITFKTSFMKNVLAMLICVLIFSLLGSLVLIPYINFLHVSPQQLSTIPVHKLFYTILFYSLVIITIVIFRNRILRITLFENINTSSAFALVVNLLLGLIAIAIQIIVSSYYSDISPIVKVSIFVSLLSYFALSIYSLSKAFNLAITKQKLESAEEYNNTLHILHDNVRGFKHDFDNIITTIGGYIKTNDMEGLKNYYLQLEDDCQQVNNLYVLNPNIINNDGIYNLITKKYYVADSKDIKINITFLLDLSTLNMKIYEFARILGILLDNAIEACNDCKEKIINLIFRDDSKNSRQLIIVENTYKNKNVNIDKIFEKGITGKENHTGLGLWEVRKLINKYKNINLHTSKNIQFFSQQLEIYYDANKD